MTAADTHDEAFTVFMRETQDRVRYALVAGYGAEKGRESAAEAFSYVWEHWERVSKMENPAGYAYRVGQRLAARSPRRPPVVFPSVTPDLPDVEPGLPGALERLSDRQRVVVVLVHGFAYTQRDVAELLQISAGSVQRHLERGLAKLRTDLGVEIDA